MAEPAPKRNNSVHGQLGFCPLGSEAFRRDTDGLILDRTPAYDRQGIIGGLPPAVPLPPGEGYGLSVPVVLARSALPARDTNDRAWPAFDLLRDQRDLGVMIDGAIFFPPGRWRSNIVRIPRPKIEATLAEAGLMPAPAAAPTPREAAR